ncbi:MAG: response regulator [Bacillota bacterium]|uniref:Response regulator transcription factor n=1 Tax=Virgibacillus salarius TaxID=447199 RepID=A0A941DWM5_9BACI|nr:MULTISPECIES: response regulator transcription factor [Bacillaceae]NAZ09402.1 response regulator [Agaribacter marinus]MBR7796692.1 response regulator transcription factor [Virgibacillus salarius]MCC2252358.1 response regulator transcription factor [Virgibacillus sp. AGTR]MDY7045866.1 response regulator transcription factor [Virgibacillus sp. M23]QRZ18621.1 response regulator transcription factor [Virgibacillus sp. AGTR]
MYRIVIAEDQKMLLGALSSLLDLEEDMEVIGQATNGEQALKLIQTLNPDICLVDIEMPVMDGLQVADYVKRIENGPKVIILTTFQKPGYFEKALKLGIDGYLLKDRSIDELSAGIRQVAAGKQVYSQELMVGILKDENPLNQREQKILQLIAMGKTAKEVASTLYLSYGTARNYISEIIQKLAAKNRIEAVEIARNKGWI